MKKKLFLGLLAAAAVTFTACQKDEVISEVIQDEAISFSTYLGRGAQTKGSIVEINELKTQGFGVFAYYTGATAASAYNFPTPNFMNNEKVYYESSAWKYDNIKYWPNTSGDKISFYAYGPYDISDNAITIDAEGNKPVLTYTVSNTISEHMDVLFAPAQEDKTKTDGAVNMTFYHALSRVGFKVYSAANYGSTPIVLTGVTLAGKFHTAGEMNLGTANITTEDHDLNPSTPDVLKVNNNWSNETTPVSNVTFSYFSGNQTVSYASTATDAAVVDNDSQYLMIIPQTFVGTGNKITLTASYTVDGLANTVSKDMEFTFEAGKAYTFAIKIGLATVDFSANVVPWDTDIDQDGNTTDDDGDNTDIEINN